MRSEEMLSRSNQYSVPSTLDMHRY